MTIKLHKIGAGSILAADLKADLAEVTLPNTPHFIVRSSQAGPFSLTTLALDSTLLLQKPNHAVNGWIVEPIGVPLAASQRLGWSVFAGFSIPGLVAALIINQEAHFLGRKEHLAAGGLWATSVVLTASHLGVSVSL